jgi:DNA relaxase NicK
VSNLEEAQRQYKDNVDETSEITTQLQSQGSNLISMTTYQNNKAIIEVKSSKARSIFHCETNQCHGFPIQVYKFYGNPFYVSHFLVGTLPRFYHSKKNPQSPSTH